VFNLCRAAATPIHEEKFTHGGALRAPSTRNPFPSHPKEGYNAFVTPEFICAFAQTALPNPHVQGMLTLPANLTVL
jgi:hypothetical protein